MCVRSAPFPKLSNTFVAQDFEMLKNTMFENDSRLFLNYLELSGVPKVKHNLCWGSTTARSENHEDGGSCRVLLK